MKRKGIVRLQLLLLVVVVGLIVWRTTRGPSLPAGIVALADIDIGEVAYAAFELDEAAPIVIDAVGSVDNRDVLELAAYGWIIHSDTRELAWSQSLETGRVEGSLLVTQDSLTLDAGSYQVFFASYGQRDDSREGRAVLGLRPHWTNDSPEWRLVVGDPMGAGRRTSFSFDEWEDSPAWSSGTLGNREEASARLWLPGPASVRVYAQGEPCLRGCDQGRITELLSGETVWEMTSENTVAAGGASRNRKFDGLVDLNEGLYEVSYSTNRTHAARSWIANPPHDPLGWGMRIWDESGSLSEYDPWLGPEPLVSFREVGNDASLDAVFGVSQPATVVVVSTGEVGSGSSIYDYAWVERLSSGERVWEMTVDGSEPAGGDRTNRVETAFLELDPGRYVLRYVSDGSHAYGDWRRTEPTVPSRWGVSLFPLSPVDPTGVITVESTSSRTSGGGGSGSGTGIAPVVPEVVLPDESALLFTAVGLGNDENVEATVTLDEATKVRVIAIGEISEAGRYDYGSIQTSSGQTVWEMTRGNTTAAGGNDINRRFDGIVELDAGTFIVRFKTDFSHSFGDFGGGGPADSEGWGIRIFRMDS